MVRWPICVVACVAGPWLPALTACAATPEAPESLARFVVTARAGGTHTRTMTVGDAWYQLQGRTLLVIDPASGDRVWSLQLAAPAASGPATDMVIVGDGLFVALDRTAVVALSVAEPRRPRIEYRVGRDELGVAPTTLSVVGDELYVSGVDGVVRWSDRARSLIGMACGTVVDSSVGVVACSGRRVHRLDDASFVGSASELHPLPEGIGPTGGFVFVRFGANATSVGLMTGRLREVNMRHATVEVDGPTAGLVRRVRVHDDRLWIVSDRRVAAYPISGDALLEPAVYPIVGARDLQFVDGRHAAVVGAFGRAYVRLDPDGGLLTLREHREPGGLVLARSDGRFVQAGGPHGWWQYEPSGVARPLAEPPGNVAPPPTRASTIAGRASIGPDGTLRLPGGAVHEETDSPAIACVVAVDGDLWIGHDLGITVLDGEGVVLDRLVLAGPVRYVFPLASGGAAWVSETGGFGTVAREPAP